MVGYSSESKAYRAERKTLKSIQVRFIESCGDSAYQSDYVIFALSPHQENSGIPPAIEDEDTDSDVDLLVHQSSGNCVCMRS